MLPWLHRYKQRYNIYKPAQICRWFVGRTHCTLQDLTLTSESKLTLYSHSKKNERGYICVQLGLKGPQVSRYGCGLKWTYVGVGVVSINHKDKLVYTQWCMYGMVKIQSKK